MKFTKTSEGYMYVTLADSVWVAHLVQLIRGVCSWCLQHSRVPCLETAAEQAISTVAAGSEKDATIDQLGHLPAA